MADNIPKVGELIGGVVQRDAIHIAVAPVIAGEPLWPGQDIGFTDENDGETVGAELSSTHIGIVDPYLHKRPLKGQRFWMFLFPQTITSLRHKWTHPAFEDTLEEATVSRNISIAWMEDFASRHDKPYLDDAPYTMDELIEAGTEFLKDGDYHVQSGSESLRDEMGDEATRKLFWEHYSGITGRELPADFLELQPFSCSC